MTFEALKEKALSLPYAPGVYIMRDKTDKVIYVGKAKKLKNRVSQYFQDTAAHTPKTKAMVSKIDHFDVLVAGSEFEALVLECSLIKRYMPKYNILLKDDKGYPYIRLNMKEPYPTMTLVNKISNDGASYFGPYGSRGVSNSIMEAIRTTLKLPGCHKQFPRDIGKERPCLNYHMDRCAGWCQTGLPQKNYRATMEEAKQLLAGNYKDVAADIKNQMLTAADNLEFELAATLRDKLNAVEALGQRFQAMLKGCQAAYPGLQILIETGRYVSGKSGTYVAKVLDKKVSHDKTFLILNGTLNAFARPAVAQMVRGFTDHPFPYEPIFTHVDASALLPLTDNQDTEVVTLAGNLCTSADIIAKDISLTRMDIGDGLALDNAGCYAAVMTPMQFACMAQPAQLFLTRDGRVLKA